LDHIRKVDTSSSRDKSKTPPSNVELEAELDVESDVEFDFKLDAELEIDSRFLTIIY